MDANLLRTARADLFVVEWSPTESRYLDRWVKNGPAWPLDRLYSSAEIEALYRRFGNKAIRVNGVPGSRAPVDIVPCFQLHYVQWDSSRGQYLVIKGVAILARDGQLTINFPDQHHQNGIAKRARTQLRFKKNVRMLKRLRDELVEGGAIRADEVPSFLVECLMYRVEDDYFLLESDDRYERLLRVVTRIHEQLNDASWVSAAREINGVKLLFGSHQGWTLDAVKKFSAEAWVRLMA
jgi:hypothetical protein